MKKLLLPLMLLGLLGCNQGAGLNKDAVKKLLKENPEILTETIEANPAKFLESMQKAIKLAQGKMQQNRADQEKKTFEESFKNPLKPNFRADEFIKGPKNAPITLVEYSDFECPFCTRGYTTYKAFMKEYKGKVRFVFKHLPLSFHKQAMIAAQYMEAIRLQSPDKGWKFHDIVFENQDKLRSGGEGFLKKTAKKLGVHMGKVAKDINSPKVKARIAEDMKEAAKFGISGTPGFILNGIPIKGAYPLSHFKKIVGELTKKGLLKL